MHLIALIGCSLAAAIIFVIAGPSSPATGFVWGLAIAAIEATGFSFFFDRMSHGSLAELFRRYAIGAFIRMPILLLLFGAVAVVLRVHGIGLIVGVGIGMAGFAILSFKKVGALAHKLQQARE